MHCRSASITRAALVGALLCTSAFALTVPKEQARAKSGRDGLATRMLIAPQTHVIADTESLDTARPFFKAKDNAFENFKLLAGSDKWVAELDKRTGLISYSEGAGIPWIPGRGNKLGAASLKALGAGDGAVTMAVMEKAARQFLPNVADMLGVDPHQLVLNQGRSGQPASHVWFVDFDVTRNGMVVEGAHVVFRVNNGNLIQFGTENLPAPNAVVPRQKLTRQQAKAALEDYIGGFDERDHFVDHGSLHLRPINLDDDSKADGYASAAGRGLQLTWEFTFKRQGEMGTWVGRVDATTGEMVEFKDRNEYGQATGGTYKQDRPATETVMPLPWANVASGTYTNSAGIFSGSTGTTTLQGKYVKISDQCGSISKAADGSGNIALGSSSGTDCTTPGSGGSGNTHAARTQFYNVNRIKEKGRGWLPTNTWLQGSLQAVVNLNQTCNAYWDGTKLNFFKSGGGCTNTGELPGVSLHEFGHGLDTNDGSGDPPDNGTGETTGDFTAALITHQSCIGNGFLTSNCSGYGDSCTACTGVRDIDYAKHSSNAPATVANFTQTKCPAPSAQEGDYVGPCGYDADARGTTSKRKEGHCESLVASQALWDLAARDMPSPGSGSAWAAVDRLWYLSRSTATGSAFQCNTSGSTWTSDGCLTGGLFRVFRAVDDDNGNLSDGTPHGGAIYNAFNRHGMACASDSGANLTHAAVTPPAAPSLSATPGANSAALSWSGSTGVYDVYRNETSCNAGFLKVANDVSATSYTDSEVANGITYYYQVQAQPSGNEAAASAPSNCVTVTPSGSGGCTPPAAPTGVAASSSSQTSASVSWNASSGATSYAVLRSTTSGSGYVQVGTSNTTSFNDGGLACGTTYYYVVTATNGSCSSANSSQASATTAACTGQNVAAYDATLKAPKCGSVGSSCDTGASLVLGRASLGPEPNQPNTIGGTCHDGTSGSYHSDESNDRLKVYTTDGSDFAAGKQVKVEATVWAYSGYTSDHLDLYYAANANSPTWTLIATLTPSGAGSQVLTGTYTLPSGSLQAVRANFRYQGSASSCSTGSYDDHDDLVFAVGGATNAPPTAAFSSTTSGLTANFTDSSSDSDGTIASRSWNFGDGGTSTATNPSHTYATGGTYTVTLQVTDNDGATDSVSHSVTVNAVCTPPAAPTGVSASSSSQTSASVSWNASSGATSYTISRSTTSGGGYSAVGTDSASPFSDSGLTCGTTYYYVVSASNGTCSSGNSAQASVTTAACSGGDTALSNGVAVSAADSTVNDQTFYYIDVPSGQSTLTVALSGGSGDADLYVRFGSHPTTSTYDCRPYLNGNNETCTFNAPAAGRWYVMLNTYAAYSGASLKATYTASAGCTTYTGSLSQGGTAYVPTSSGYVSSVSGSHTGALVGPAQKDFDLYLQKKSGSSWSNVASSTSSSNVENVNYSGTAGTYRWRVVAYSGSGSYSLCIAHP